MNEAKRIETSKGPLSYRDVGHGPVVVFVHGFLVDGQLWRKVVPILSRTHRCIVPDWPLGSHREPMKPDADLSPTGVAALVAELLQRLDLHDVTLVGNDSGGAIAQLVTARHGERIGRLLLTNCDAFELFPPPAFEHFALLPRVPGLIWLMAFALRRIPALRRLRTTYGAITVRPIPADQTRAWVTPLAELAGVRRDAAKFIRGVDPALTLAVAAELGRLAPRVQLVWGESDPFFPLSLATRLRGAIPGAQLETVPDCGAFVAEDAPEVLAAAIARFAAPGARVAVA